MQTFWQILVITAVLIGTFFSVVGVLGYYRLPDVYTKLHAAGKVGVFGVVLLLIAATIWTPLSIGRGLILISLLLLTGPVTSHAVSSAAYRLKVPLRQAIRDDLADKTNH
ncbi:MAG: monovalent cation/H(+) antiporter subunit G [Anaerolineae bacterium]|jgi:multicomponent Na+:H+ antiporter subunit G|nr:monovalent cation/H(+) antiporter subunit G [Anaerolineae bacterium]